jgi:uncharacterized protein (DUF433 family)
MSNAKLKLMINVFRRRIEAGESFEEVAESYPKLTNEELDLIYQNLYD